MTRQEVHRYGLGPANPLPLVRGATCGHVHLEYCEQAYGCIAQDEDRSSLCRGHRTTCNKPAFVYIDAPIPTGFIRAYSCGEHWEQDLIQHNDFPPDPGYGTATCTFYPEELRQ